MKQATRFDLRHADCVAGIGELPACSIDIVVTSPPYNLGIDYGNYHDSRDPAEYLGWTREWAAAVRRVLRDDGSFFLNVGASPANPLLPHQIALEMASLFVLQNTLHWIKSITVETRDGAQISAGHFKPINSPRFLTDCHEYLFHFTASGNVPIDRLAVGVPYADKSNIARWSHTGGRDLRCRGNNWFIPYKTIKSRANDRPHPATFPPQLAEQCIRLHGVNPGLTVLDPFLGLGSSAIAAARCGAARFIGFEIDDTYLAEAQKAVASLDATKFLLT